MAGVKISDVKKAIPLARQLVAKLDADKDKKVSQDEVKRIRVRDNYVARNMVRAAMDKLSWPDNPGPYDVKGVQASVDGVVKALERADKDKDGKLTPQELSNASRAARTFVEFAQKYADKSVAVFDVKPYEKPGTAAWVALAKQEYFGGPDEPMNRPYFGTALLIPRNELDTAKLKAGWDALAAANPGAKLQATSRLINGEPVIYMHAMKNDRYDVRVFDEAGKQLASGVARPKTDPRATWSVRWD